jgi:UDP-N-acetylglucosamine 2-epimerase (non-hydrolysing)
LKKVLIIFGTRPEAIKMCPLVLQLRRNKSFETRLCVTGQHQDMLRQVLEYFDVKEDYSFDIMSANQTLSHITSSVLGKMEQLLREERFDLVLVHGDTSTTFAAALAAYYNRTPVGHVEAGLRTYDIFAPYPEEFNRHAASLITDLHFAPTSLAAENLINEGIDKEKIFVTGNTVIDAMRYTLKLDYTHPALDWLQGAPMLLLTAHRRENWGAPLENIFSAIIEILERHKELKVIYPVHLNPTVKNCADKILGEHPRVKLTPPVDVIALHNFIRRAYMVLTDSGGIQEEASALNKPTLVLRNATERPEGVTAGILKLVGTEKDNIVAMTEKLLRDKQAYDMMCNAKNPYGDGHACERIERIMMRYFKG